MKHSIFVYGPGGTGKTTFAATLPAPILHLMFDVSGKELPFRRFGEVAEYNENGLPIVEVYDGGNLRSRTEIWSMKPGLEKNPHEFTDRLSKSDSKFETVVLDSATTYAKFLKYASMEHLNPEWKDNRKHYGYMADYIGMCIFNLLPKWKANRVVISHLRSVDVEKGARSEGIDGTMVRVPNLPGQLREEYSAGFTEIYRAWFKTDEKKASYVLQTKPNGQFHACSAIGAKNNFSNIWEEIVS